MHTCICMHITTTSRGGLSTERYYSILRIKLNSKWPTCFVFKSQNYYFRFGSAICMYVYTHKCTRVQYIYAVGDLLIDLGRRGRRIKKLFGSLTTPWPSNCRDSITPKFPKQRHSKMFTRFDTIDFVKNIY